MRILQQFQIIARHRTVDLTITNGMQAKFTFCIQFSTCFTSCNHFSSLLWSCLKEYLSHLEFPSWAAESKLKQWCFSRCRSGPKTRSLYRYTAVVSYTFHPNKKWLSCIWHKLVDILHDGIMLHIMYRPSQLFLTLFQQWENLSCMPLLLGPRLVIADCGAVDSGHSHYCSVWCCPWFKRLRQRSCIWLAFRPSNLATVSSTICRCVRTRELSAIFARFPFNW